MSSGQEGETSTKRIFCNRCKGETNHTFVSERSRADTDEYQGQLIYWEETIYRMWVCAGCGVATLEQAWTMDGYRDREDKHQIYDSTYHPRRTKLDVARKRFRQLPGRLDAIYREAVSAFNGELYILCAAGLRALIEGICEDQDAKGSRLEDKIDALVGRLPDNIVTSLHEFRFIGNEALHQLTAPSATDLRLAIEVTEDLLNFLFELDYKASRLQRRVSRGRKRTDN